MEKVGKKNDFLDNKLRWDLLPLGDIEDIVKVYTAGAKKYGDNNWQYLENGYDRYKAAMFRHLVEYERGNIIDPDTNCAHLAQVAWNAIALLHLSKVNDYILENDPYIEEVKSDTDELVEKLNNRIQEKVDTCNDILDQIQATTMSKKHKEILDAMEHSEEVEKQIMLDLNKLRVKLAKETDFHNVLNISDREIVIDYNLEELHPFKDKDHFYYPSTITNKGLTDLYNRISDAVDEAIAKYKGETK